MEAREKYRRGVKQKEKGRGKKAWGVFLSEYSCIMMKERRKKRREIKGNETTRFFFSFFFFNTFEVMRYC